MNLTVTAIVAKRILTVKMMRIIARAMTGLIAVTVIESMCIGVTLVIMRVLMKTNSCMLMAEVGTVKIALRPAMTVAMPTLMMTL